MTCSPECATKQRIAAHAGKALAWSDKARQRKAARGQDENLKKGTAAAKSSPRSGPFETNVNALEWVLVSPEGAVYEAHNLSHFCREHAAECDATPEQMSAGIRAVKASLEGRRKDKVGSYKGWTLRRPTSR